MLKNTCASFFLLSMVFRVVSPFRITFHIFISFLTDHRAKTMIFDRWLFFILCFVLLNTILLIISFKNERSNSYCHPMFFHWFCFKATMTDPEKMKYVGMIFWWIYFAHFHSWKDVVNPFPFNFILVSIIAVATN